MIKLTNISSKSKNAPTLFLIAGGPGLSSITLRSMDVLARSFNLAYVDMPGTNGNPYTKDHSHQELSEALQLAVKQVAGKKFVLGHSYGGFLAADCLLAGVCDGIVCVATPFSDESLNDASKNYETHMTDALVAAGNEWGKKKDDRALARWLSEYGKLYFCNPDGKNLILNDKVSAKYFIANRGDIGPTGSVDKVALLRNLSAYKCVRLFIAGAEDKLLPEKLLKEDSNRGGFDFASVKDASHFVTFDQPEIVARLIEDKLLR
ncbi:MAG: hypothetical protein A2504_16920 [Bdellovibrionales bacterium RIFOXYD12_FULL_39_22]|nr:MAG: hypothetical protein A2385_05860 [Bdellovibrionales bacterium RIFOXYB1_FULL_39_21]OFZ41478.1 MAG: hypothetical protein A2485_04610 [Bdellovibrionales bacterium RIFOXYC12_FULL_39_17]OFZ50380.1 MAG: hypothetical protein A2404_02440 [Bdellovibrionales bacterium RIFOXYC1_FULL_39_130]OFZ77659.1 MAG: hypothetical protein A2560_16515 [Bdellovibrionales bacterium RIFOXYD1_FULL_39_84]OFZ92198.1 MAG: hypothetical protein A2504_16920 [Bdellovibrionales bacterium RIFOXYD12_FULL_39_22]HLE12705.1 al